MNLQKINRMLSERIFKTVERGSQLDNTYIPPAQRKFVCVSKTVEPETKGFNETFQHIHEQLKPKYE